MGCTDVATSYRIYLEYLFPDSFQFFNIMTDIILMFLPSHTCASLLHLRKENAKCKINLGKFRYFQGTQSNCTYLYKDKTQVLF